MDELLQVLSDPNVLILIAMLVGCFVLTVTGIAGLLFVCQYLGWLF